MHRFLLLILTSLSLSYPFSIEITTAPLTEYRPKVLLSYPTPSWLEPDSMFGSADMVDTLLGKGIEVLKLGNKEFEQGNYEAAVNFYEEILELADSTASPQIRLLTENALAMTLFALNRQDSPASYNTASSAFRSFLPSLALIGPHSAPVARGADLRAFILFNYADGTYYSSYVRGEIRNNKRREDARLVYATILDKYKNSSVADLAWTSLAWYSIESRRFDAAISSFDSILSSTQDKNTQVLASYGKALSLYYKGDYRKAESWFFDEQGLKDRLNVTVAPQESSDTLPYNELADSLITRTLFYRAKCLERLGAYGDVLAVYEHIAYTYPARPTAGEASQKIIEFYIRAKQIDKAVAETERVNSMMTKYGAIYRDAYGYGLAALYDYYQGDGDTAKANYYIKRLTGELGTTDPVEQLYYRQAMRDTAFGDVENLKTSIKKIKNRNPRSQYLPDPLFLLANLLFAQKNYEEAKAVLTELNNWPNTEFTHYMLPDITYKLGYCDYNLGSYPQAITEFEAWLKYYTRGEETRPDIAPNVYYCLALSCIEAEKVEKSEKRSIELLQKALANLQTIKDKYSDSGFYRAEGMPQAIDSSIQTCKAGIPE